MLAREVRYFNIMSYAVEAMAWGAEGRNGRRRRRLRINAIQTKRSARGDNGAT